MQVGALNFTGDLHGVQLGVLNFSNAGGAFVFPIFNLWFYPASSRRLADVLELDAEAGKVLGQPV